MICYWEGVSGALGRASGLEQVGKGGLDRLIPSSLFGTRRVNHPSQLV